MGENWKSIKEVLTSTCQEVLGFNNRHYKEWISKEDPYKIQEMKNKKAAINNSQTRTENVEVQVEYTETNKGMKKSPKVDKKMTWKKYQRQGKKLQEKEI
ncbi:unnamed protein product [Schistosoma margrebowiei]|uniref:Uncharacterized protein n=1 Tax=Schistosoma margrebowiei TaxID=48269 RepID=A0A183LUX2_9TREM|nr:unnamed protein product [Schistosoma margrebowiei]